MSELSPAAAASAAPAAAASAAFSSSPPQAVPQLCKRQVRRAFSRAAAAQSAAAVAESPANIPARRLWERVQCMAQRPALAADIGGSGRFLRQCFPQARVLALDFALPVLCGGREGAAICADAEQLPLADASLDLLWSNLCVEWTDARAMFAEGARVLKEGALFAFTALGPDTLCEMRQVFNGENRVHNFADMHDLGDALLACGFSEPLMEAEKLTLTYSSARQALTDARQLGGGNAWQGRRPLTRGGWRRAIEKYQENYRQDDGKVAATYEVIYATAWRGGLSAAGRAGGEAGVGASPLRFFRMSSGGGGGDMDSLGGAGGGGEGQGKG